MNSSDVRRQGRSLSHEALQSVTAATVQDEDKWTLHDDRCRMTVLTPSHRLFRLRHLR